MQNLEKVAKALSFYYNKDIKDIKVENYISFTRVPLSLASLLTIYKKFKRIVYSPLAIVKLTLVISYSRGYKAF